MTELQAEDRKKIEDHLHKYLEKLKKNKKTKLIRKFESLICNNANISTQSSTDIDDDSSPRVTLLTSTAHLPNGTADLLDLGPQFVPTTKTINSKIELEVNVQLAKLAYLLRWKEIHNELTATNDAQQPVHSVSSESIEQAIERCPFDKYCKAPETKFQHLELSLQHLKYEVKKVINKHKSRCISSILARNQRETLAQLTTLKKAREVRISVSDKGGEFVVMDSNLDNQLMDKHLGNVHSKIKNITQRMSCYLSLNQDT